MKCGDDIFYISCLNTTFHYVVNCSNNVTVNINKPFEIIKIDFFIN